MYILFGKYLFCYLSNNYEVLILAINYIITAHVFDYQADIKLTFTLVRILFER